MRAGVDPARPRPPKVRLDATPPPSTLSAVGGGPSMMRILAFLGGVFLVLLGSRLLRAQAPPAHGHRDGHGNPQDLDAYIARLMDPARDEWQKPDELIRALGLKDGQVACDVGSGPGYLTLRLAPAVGSSGLVYAVDVEPRLLEALKQHLRDGKVEN